MLCHLAMHTTYTSSNANRCVTITWTVRRLASSVCIHALMVSSAMNIMTALLSNTGTSPLIIYTKIITTNYVCAKCVAYKRCILVRGWITQSGLSSTRHVKTVGSILWEIKDLQYLHFFIHFHNFLYSSQRHFWWFPMFLMVAMTTKMWEPIQLLTSVILDIWRLCSVHKFSNNFAPSLFCWAMRFCCNSCAIILFIYIQHSKIIIAVLALIRKL